MAQSYASPYTNLGGTELVDRLKEDLASNKWNAERPMWGPGQSQLSPLESKTRIGKVLGMQGIDHLFDVSHDERLQLAKEAYESAVLLSQMRDAIVDNGIYDVPFNPGPENPFSNERPLGQVILGYAIQISETLAHGVFTRSDAPAILKWVKESGIQDKYSLYLALAMSYSRDVSATVIKSKMKPDNERAVEDLEGKLN